MGALLQREIVSYESFFLKTKPRTVTCSTLFFAILTLDYDVDYNHICTRATPDSTFRCTPVATHFVTLPHPTLGFFPAILLPSALRPFQSLISAKNFRQT